MATYAETRIYGPAQPATTDATLYTVPGATTAIIKQIIVTNTTGSPATLSLGINGTPATAANAFMSAVSFAANSITTIDLSLPLAAADTIHGLQGTASAITVTVSGVLKT